MNHQKVNLALVCTVGGHLEQMTNLSEFYKRYDHFWITNRNKQSISHLENERKYFINMAHYKKPWTYLYQIPLLIRIFAKERPTHVLSTGSGRTALVPFLLAKIANIDFLYIDTFSRVNGHSKFGAFLLSIGHHIFTQWKDHHNEKAIYIGPIFPKIAYFNKTPNSNHIFVTVGTRTEGFKRLIQAVEALVKKGLIKEKVIVQGGHTEYTSDYLDIFDFCTPEKVEDLIVNAKYVITQESAGIGTQCLKYQTKFIVMPRRYEYGELPSKSDMNEDLHFKIEEMGYTKVVTNVPELKKAIDELDNLKVGFTFNNELAMETLTRVMEGI